MILEEPVLFGPDGGMLGLLSTAADVPSRGTAVLLFNAGVIHRIGPHRLNVRVARELAAVGLPTLRFDISGSGDSAAAAGALNFRDQAVRDLKIAMDLLGERTGAKRILIFGICSGAVNAFWGAVADPRVVGIMMYDGFWYRARWTTLARMWQRFRAKPFAALTSGIRSRLSRLRRSVAPAAPAAAGIFQDSEENGNPPKAEVASLLSALVKRGVSVFVLYGGSILDNYSYQGQFRDAFRGEDFVDKVRCELHRDIDHTIVSQDVQQKLAQLIREWASATAAVKSA